VATIDAAERRPAVLQLWDLQDTIREGAVAYTSLAIVPVDKDEALICCAVPAGENRLLLHL